MFLSNPKGVGVGVGVGVGFLFFFISNPPARGGGGTSDGEGVGVGVGFLFFRFGWTPASKPTGLCSSLPVFLQFWGKGDGREERATATEISQFTEVAAAATATLRLAGNGLTFRTIYFPSSASFFRFPSYEMLGFFCYLLRFLYPLGVPNGAVLFEYLVHGFECLIREFLFWRFFLLFWFSFWVTDLHRFLLPTATIRG